MYEILVIVTSQPPFTNSQSNLLKGVGVIISILIILVVWWKVESVSPEVIDAGIQLLGYCTGDFW